MLDLAKALLFGVDHVFEVLDLFGSLLDLEGKLEGLVLFFVKVCALLV